MSHDQKPAKMRVVGRSAHVPARRRTDAQPASFSAAAAAPTPATAAKASPGGRGRGIMLGALFLVGSLGAGVAAPLLGVFG